MEKGEGGEKKGVLRIIFPSFTFHRIGKEKERRGKEKGGRRREV